MIVKNIIKFDFGELDYYIKSFVELNKYDPEYLITTEETYDVLSKKANDKLSEDIQYKTYRGLTFAIVPNDKLNFGEIEIR